MKTSVTIALTVQVTNQCDRAVDRLVCVRVDRRSGAGQSVVPTQLFNSRHLRSGVQLLGRVRDAAGGRVHRIDDYRFAAEFDRRSRERAVAAERCGGRRRDGSIGERFPGDVCDGRYARNNGRVRCGANRVHGRRAGRLRPDSGGAGLRFGRFATVQRRATDRRSRLPWRQQYVRQRRAAGSCSTVRGWRTWMIRRRMR